MCTPYKFETFYTFLPYFWSFWLYSFKSSCLELHRSPRMVKDDNGVSRCFPNCTWCAGIQIMLMVNFEAPICGLQFKFQPPSISSSADLEKCRNVLYNKKKIKWIIKTKQPGPRQWIQFGYKSPWNVDVIFVTSYDESLNLRFIWSSIFEKRSPGRSDTMQTPINDSRIAVQSFTRIWFQDGYFN